MDSQLDAVRHRICKAEDEIVEVKQGLAAAKQDLETARQTNNKEKERFLCDLLLGLNNQLGGLNNQLSGLQEEKNILLRSQAPGKPCLQLLHTGLSVLTSFAPIQLKHVSSIILVALSSKGLTIMLAGQCCGTESAEYIRR